MTLLRKIYGGGVARLIASGLLLAGLVLAGLAPVVAQDEIPAPEPDDGEAPQAPQGPQRPAPEEESGAGEDGSGENARAPSPDPADPGPLDDGGEQGPSDEVDVPGSQDDAVPDRLQDDGWSGGWLFWWYCSAFGESHKCVGEEGSAPDGDDSEPDVTRTDGPGTTSKNEEVATAKTMPASIVVGISLGLVALVAALWMRLLMLVVMGLPAGWRLDRQRVTQHPVRGRMLEHLRTHPGATVQELADVAEVRNSRAMYHLAILKREEVVSERRVDGRKHYFLHAAPVMDAHRMRKRALLRPQRAPWRVLELVSRCPGASVTHVARTLGFSPGHAHYHLTRLVEKGLMDRARHGRRVRHYLTDEGHEWVTRHVSPEVPEAPDGSGPAADAVDTLAA